VRRSLASGEYAQREAACRRAAAGLGVVSLRDADELMLARGEARLDLRAVKCARHVISENTRVQGFADALTTGDLARAGKLMAESHVSLRDDFRVSCPELDAMVETTMGLAGVFGSRMTGAGFGGCTVTLCRPGVVDSLVRAIAGLTAGRPAEKAFVARAVQGARAWRLNP
jgi:galactokinase